MAYAVSSGRWPHLKSHLRRDDAAPKMGHRGSSFRLVVFAVAAVVLMAAMVWFGDGLDPWWPLMWFAPLPVMVIAVRSGWRAAAVVSFLGMLLGSFSMWHYFRAMGLPVLLWFGLYGTASVVFMAGVLLFRALVLRGRAWAGVVSLPALMVGFEYVRNIALPHGTAGSLAYTQLHFLPFLQLASITGPWGMSFVLLLFPSALAAGFALRTSAMRQAAWIVGGVLGLIAAVLLFGAVRLARPAGEMVRVGLIASDAPGNARPTGRVEDTERLLNDYAAVAERLVADGAQVVVIPEKLGVMPEVDAGKIDAIFQPLADRTGATIVAGVERDTASAKYNEARVYEPKSAVRTYDKHHMLPPFESYLTPGTTLTVLKKHAARWGIGICKDMDFTGLSRKDGLAGVGLMLVPAWDFDMDRTWHGHIAVMRGVESGFSIARAAKFGYLTVSDSRGRIVAETRSDAAPFATLMAEVSAAHHRTFFLVAGDWFVVVAVVLVVWVLVELDRVRRRLAG